MSGIIDLSRLPPPAIVEVLDFDTLHAGFVTRYEAAWHDMAQLQDPPLPDYDVGTLAFDPAVVSSQAWSGDNMLLRGRINDAVRAVLAPTAKGDDLENVVAWANIQKLVIRPATETEPAIMESDERLLRRYLLGLSKPAAGSAARYMLEALTAWPECHDVKVIGRAIHGRRGDVDVVIAGPEGRAPTEGEMALVRDAIRRPEAAPEAVSVSLLPATRRLYDVRMRLVVPQGADADLVKGEAEARVRKVAADRLKIGVEVPREQLAGGGYGPSVIRLSMPEPAADIPSDPYAIPILGVLDVTYEVGA